MKHFSFYWNFLGRKHCKEVLFRPGFLRKRINYCYCVIENLGKCFLSWHSKNISVSTNVGLHWRYCSLSIVVLVFLKIFNIMPAGIFQCIGCKWRCIFAISRKLKRGMSFCSGPLFHVVWHLYKKETRQQGNHSTAKLILFTWYFAQCIVSFSTSYEQIYLFQIENCS